MKPLVFYSAVLGEDAPLSQGLAQSNIQVHAESLIEHSVFDFDCPSHLESAWIFFTSPRALEVFQKKCSLDKFKIACLGKGTLKALGNHYEATFVGEGEVEEVAQQFRRVLGDEDVVFPCSKQSLLRVPSALPSSQVKVLYTYSTLARSQFSIPDADVYFFTSPSNVHAFFSKQIPAQNSRFLTMGLSTQEALLSYGHPSITPKNYLPEAQLEAIKQSLGR